jgi:hypothetical protein
MVCFAGLRLKTSLRFTLDKFIILCYNTCNQGATKMFETHIKFSLIGLQRVQYAISKDAKSLAGHAFRNFVGVQWVEVLDTNSGELLLLMDKNITRDRWVGVRKH